MALTCVIINHVVDAKPEEQSKNDINNYYTDVFCFATFASNR